jgi:uncharacterized protein (TIGR02268 family)
VSLSLPATLLMVVLLDSAPSAEGQAPRLTCATGVRYLVLEAGDAEQHRVCIRPGMATNLYFDAKVVSFEVTERERFRVLEGADGLGLRPVGEFVDGERFPMTVNFADGVAPVSARFVLVVHPTQAEPQVEVSRQVRTLASYREGEQQARAEERQCQADKTRLVAQCSAKGGLIGLLEEGWLETQGVGSKDMSKSLLPREGNTLEVGEAFSYRAKGLLAVELRVFNHGTTPWQVAGAVLMGPKPGETKQLRLGTVVPIAPGTWGGVVMQVEATEEEARATFRLKLWEGSRSVEWEGVTFP